MKYGFFVILFYLILFSSTIFSMEKALNNLKFTLQTLSTKLSDTKATDSGLKKINEFELVSASLKNELNKSIKLINEQPVESQRDMWFHYQYRIMASIHALFNVQDFHDLAFFYQKGLNEKDTRQLILFLKELESFGANSIQKFVNRLKEREVSFRVPYEQQIITNNDLIDDALEYEVGIKSVITVLLPLIEKNDYKEVKKLLKIMKNKPLLEKNGATFENLATYIEDDENREILKLFFGYINGFIKKDEIKSEIQNFYTLLLNAYNNLHQEEYKQNELKQPDIESPNFNEEWQKSLDQQNRRFNLQSFMNLLHELGITFDMRKNISMKVFKAANEASANLLVGTKSCITNIELKKRRDCLEELNNMSLSALEAMADIVGPLFYFGELFFLRRSVIAEFFSNLKLEVLKQNLDEIKKLFKKIIQMKDLEQRYKEHGEKTLEEVTMLSLMLDYFMSSIVPILEERNYKPLDNVIEVLQENKIITNFIGTKEPLAIEPLRELFKTGLIYNVFYIFAFSNYVQDSELREKIENFQMKILPMLKKYLHQYQYDEKNQFNYEALYEYTNIIEKFRLYSIH